MSSALDCQLDHVVNAYRRYPGETLIFHTRIIVPPEIASKASLRVTLPKEVTFKRTEAPAEIKEGPRVSTGRGGKRQSPGLRSHPLKRRKNLLCILLLNVRLLLIMID